MLSVLVEFARKWVSRNVHRQQFCLQNLIGPISRAAFASTDSVQETSGDPSQEDPPSW